MQSRGMDAGAVEKMIYGESGLLGVSGVSSDMRTLLASPEPRARLAVDLYVYRIGRELGSLAAALGGLDAIVFTGGIGENSPLIRRMSLDGMTYAGIALDEAKNNTAKGEMNIAAAGSRIQIWTVPTNEEIVVARQTVSAVESAKGQMPMKESR
jgi:acetate kinase